MGLPVWRVPSPEPEATRKRDAAALARSPIRRRARRSQRRVNATTWAPTRNPDAIAAQDVDDTWQPGQIPPPPVPELHLFSRHRDVASRTARRSPWDHSDYSQYSLYRRDHDRNTQHDSPLPAYTPNFAPSVASHPPAIERPSSADPHDSAADRDDDEDLTEVLAGSRTAYGEEHNDFPEAQAADHSRDLDFGADYVSLPPLRRMGRPIADGPLPASSLRETWSPATDVDGLGDRNRSPSPAADDWDTFLSTVAPDPVPPTADSSFTSAAASASFTASPNPSSRAGSSNSNSVLSSRTHLTVPSHGDSPPVEGFLYACESDSSASDTEVDYAPPRRLSRLRRGSLRDVPRSPENISELTSYGRPRQSWYSFYNRPQRRVTSLADNRPRSDQVDGATEPLGSFEERFGPQDSTQDQELRDARTILERLTQREDVSDEFWASVGLTRSMADRVESIQQRDRTTDS